MVGGGGNIAEILWKYTASIKVLAKKVCHILPSYNFLIHLPYLQNHRKTGLPSALMKSL